MDSNGVFPGNGSLLSPPVAEMDGSQPKSEQKEEESSFIDVEEQKPGTSSTGLPFDSPVSVEIEPANIDVKMEKVNECGVCGILTTPLLKEDGQLGSVEGGYEMSQISPHGRVYKHNINEDEDTFWISCDECQRWFHGRCVLVEEYQDGLIEKFFCPTCSEYHGPSRMRQVVAPHRLAFDDKSQVNQPPEVGTRVWIEHFISWEMDIPEPDESHVAFFENGYEFTEKFNRDENWSKVFLIKDPKGLELRMPPADFSTTDLVRIFGEQHQVDTIDVYRQVTHSMTLGSFHRRFQSTNRDRIYNFLSLEFSKNEQMKDLIAPPIIVYELSFVHKFWPDKSDPINYDEEMDFLPEHACLAKEIEVAEEHKKSRPDVALFCLCGMGGSYTDFHIDFGGSSVWYHIYKGQKVFYIAEPSARNLKAYEEHQTLEKRTERFLGDLLMAGELRRIVINEGETLMIPSGWIHAVYTPVDSLVFGGNFLHQLNIPMQLKVYDIEQKTRAEIGMDEKFLFPQFELVHWYAARSILLMAIKEDNDQGKQAPPTIFNSTKALLPYLKRWLEKDELALGKPAVMSNYEVYKKLKREFDTQDRLRKEENGDGDGSGRKKGSKKSKKKKKEESDEDDDYRPKLKMKISRAKIQRPEENGEEEEPGPIETPRHSDNFTERILQEVHEDDEPHEKFGIRFTKKGSKYSSELVEKPTPMIGEVNMAQMFARRSSSGRTPKAASWLIATAGDEIEKEAKKLEETGDMPKAREPLLYSKAMDKLMATEDREDEEFEERKRKKSKTEKVTVPHPVQAAPKKSQGSTAKQRLASKLGLRK